MVYAGHFFSQYPCGWLIGRFPAQKVIALSILLWGAMVLILSQCRTYSTACKVHHSVMEDNTRADMCISVAVRFLMGVFEAAVTP